MQRLQTACYASDARLRIRSDITNKARLMLGVGVGIPFLTYLIYHMYAPSGVMQNHRASNGAYLYWVQNFLGTGRSNQAIYRPQFAIKESTAPLFEYSKKIEKLRAEESDELVQEVHHPKAWH